MKKILIDHQCFEMQEFGGVSKVYCEIIPLLREYYDCTISIKYSNNKHLINSQIVEKIKPLKKYNIPILSKYQFYQKKYIQRIVYNKNRNIYRSIRLLKNQEFDIFEPTFFDPYFLPFLKDKPFVLQVHDMIPELFPQYFGIDNFQLKNKKIICPKAAAIHVPSLRTKEDLVNILNINPEKITVIPHGSSNIPIPKSTLQKPTSNPYILYVGNRLHYKNFDLLLREMTIIAQSEPDIELICTGLAFNDNEQRLISNLGLTEHVHYCYATNDNFYALYHYALAFVYPSAYEGFGLPILEAWFCGCPVMLNNASCFPEVGGNAAIYFDINIRGDLAAHILSFYYRSSEDRNDIITKGKERLTNFSWEKSAKQLKKLYDSIV